MKPLQMFEDTSTNKAGQSCCAPPQDQLKLSADMAARQQAVNSMKEIISEKPRWQRGIMNTASGLVPVVTGEWSRADRWGQIRARMGSFRMEYIVKPGLYAIGSPDAESDIFVSANYKLSFDILRRELAGINGWILVLDTKGINVWCAAGKGTFGTDELVKRVLAIKSLRPCIPPAAHRSPAGSDRSQSRRCQEENRLCRLFRPGRGFGHKRISCRRPQSLAGDEEDPLRSRAAAGAHPDRAEPGIEIVPAGCPDIVYHLRTPAIRHPLL